MKIMKNEIAHLEKATCINFQFSNPKLVKRSNSVYYTDPCAGGHSMK